MRSFRVSLVGMILAVLLVGCDGGTEGTTMPTSPPTMPPEADQMKKEMTKNFGINFQPKGALTSKSPKTHRKRG
jgi:hypothetical protein